MALTATVEGIEQGAYYTDGFTLYYVEKVSPRGKLVDIENCFLREGAKCCDVRGLPELKRVYPEKNMPTSRHLADQPSDPSGGSG